MLFARPSPYRKLLLRGLAVFFILFFGGVGLVFVYRITEPISGREPVPLSQAEEYYHYYYSAASEKKIAFTFDDGPTVKYTLAITDILEKNNAPGTFFFVGQNVLANPRIARQVTDKGFLVGNHTFTHAHAVHDSKERLAVELNATSYLIERATGKKPTYYRPPFLLAIGVDPTINPYQPIPKAAVWPLEMGYVPVGADIDSKDWEAASAEDVYTRTMHSVARGGHIVLFHDEKYTVEALPRIIRDLRAEGYTLVGLDELLTPPSPIALAQDLRMGNTNAQSGGAVSELQWFLYTQGFLDAYSLTGIYDSETEEAVKQFQVRSGIVDPTDLDPSIYGVVDERTRVAIALATEKSFDETIKAPTSLYLAAATAASATESAFVWSVSGLLVVVSFIVWQAVGLMMVRLGIITALLARAKILRLPKHRYATDESAIPRGVSVIVPAYNEVENIKATLLSVIANRDIKKQIIVVDDGSTDGTHDVVEKVIDAHPKEDIRLLRLENGGKARALNIGLKSAKYQFVVCMDGDTMFTRHTIKALVAPLADPTVGAVAGKVYTVHSRSFLSRMQALEYMLGQNIDKRALETVNGINVVPGPVGGWRKKALLRAGGFSTETLAEDQDMTLAVSRLGYTIAYAPKALAFTETPPTVRSFLKQRFRWVYGTIQCFWKYKHEMIASPRTGLGGFALPNMLMYSIILPLMYPIVDIVLVVSIFTGSFDELLIPALLFTCLDMVYALFGSRGEKNQLSMLAMVPVVRLVYRQLLYYVVIKAIVRAFEGGGMGWNKVVKTGQVQEVYLSNLAAEASLSAPMS